MGRAVHLRLSSRDRYICQMAESLRIWEFRRCCVIRRFGHWDIIQSDAGALGSEWQGPVCRDQLKIVLIGPLGGWSLQRVMDLMSDEPNTWGVLAAIYPQLDAITASYVLRTLRTLAGTETALPPGTVLDGDAPVLRAHSGSSGATGPAADRPNPCPSTDAWLGNAPPPRVRTLLMQLRSLTMGTVCLPPAAVEYWLLARAAVGARICRCMFGPCGDGNLQRRRTIRSPATLMETAEGSLWSRCVQAAAARRSCLASAAS